MKHPSRTARWMAGCLLALWCVAFLRAETTEKSMVRALFLRQGGQGLDGELAVSVPGSRRRCLGCRGEDPSLYG